MKTSGAYLLCSMAGLLSACGSAASYDYDLPPSVEKPPLTTLHGQLDKKPDAPREHVKVALVWFPVSLSTKKAQRSQSVVSRSSWFDVDIDVKHLPPEGAVERADMMTYGQAEVILYEDRNDNDRLDIEMGGSEDRVLGRANGVRVWWLDAGSPAPPDARGYLPITMGWSLTYGPIKEDPDPSDCAPDPQPGGILHPRCPLRTTQQARDVPQQSAFTISVSSDPALQRYTCAGFRGMSREKTDEWPDDTPGWNAPEVRKKICNPATCSCKDKSCGLDLPPEGQKLALDVTCYVDKANDTTNYVWKACAPDPNLCNTVFCHTGVGARDNKLPPPANWPTCK